MTVANQDVSRAVQKRAFPKWTAAALLPLLFCSAYYVGTRNNTPPTLVQSQVVSGLAVSESALNLGDLWEEKSHVCHLPIENRSNAQITVWAFAVSCGCMGSVEPGNFTIQPNETKEISLKLDLTSRSKDELGRELRPFSHQLMPQIKGHRASDGWRLHGEIKSRVTFDCANVHFGQAPIKGYPPVVSKVEMTAHVPVGDVKVRVDPEVANVRIARDRTAPSNRCILEISSKDALDVGPFRGELVAEIIGLDGQLISGGWLEIAGEMQPEVRVIPAQILLGPQPVGQRAEANVVLQIPPKSQWTVDHVEVDSKDVVVVPTAIEGVLAGLAFKVSIDVKAVGDKAQKVVFVVRKDGPILQRLSTEILVHGVVGPSSPVVDNKGPRP